MAILDLSKLHMYAFFYNGLKPKYGDEIKLAYTDTDSFVTHIETEDVFKDFREIGEHMDFSDYPVDHLNHSTAIKKIIGKLTPSKFRAVKYVSVLSYSPLCVRSNHAEHKEFSC